MKKEEIFALFKSYEDAVCTIDNTVCWSARDLQKFLGYSLWQNFTNIINKAKDMRRYLSKGIKYWDYTEVLEVHEALQKANESINKLELVPVRL